MLPSDLHDLLRHMEWADSLVWNAVLSLPEATSDAGMRERLYHTHLVQWAYLQIWRGLPLDMRDASSFEGIDAIHTWARDYYGQLAEYLEAVATETFERHIEFPWAEQLVERFGDVQQATLAETILQITSHTTYHRGQVNTRLRELGGEPPLTDFIAWIWMGRPSSAWAVS